MDLIMVAIRFGVVADGNVAQTATLISALAAFLIAISAFAGIRYNRWKQKQDHGIQVEQLAEQKVANTRTFTLEQIDRQYPGVQRVIEILTNQVDRQEAQLIKQQEKIDQHEVRIDELEAENQQLRLRLEAVQARLPGDVP